MIAYGRGESPLPVLAVSLRKKTGMLQLVQLFRRRKNSTPSGHLALGAAGEKLALEHLESAGYRTVATNYVVPLGRGTRGQPVSGEIDIVAYEGNVLCFIEVKTRSSDSVATPERAVTLAKQRQIARAARRYRSYMNIGAEPYRFDVVGIVISESGVPEITLTRNFFADPLRRKRAHAAS